MDNPALYYDIVKQIGTGGYGKIYLVQAKSDKAYYALKFINHQKNAQQAALPGVGRDSTQTHVTASNQ